MLISRAADNPSGGRDSHAEHAGGSGFLVVERYRPDFAHSSRDPTSLSAQGWCS
jgi:hypothetical protein